jgi:hypothetical protein
MAAAQVDLQQVTMAVDQVVLRQVTVAVERVDLRQATVARRLAVRSRVLPRVELRG